MSTHTHTYTHQIGIGCGVGQGVSSCSPSYNSPTHHLDGGCKKPHAWREGQGEGQGNTNSLKPEGGGAGGRKARGGRDRRGEG